MHQAILTSTTVAYLSTACRYSTASTKRRRSWHGSTASTARKRGCVGAWVRDRRISNLSGSGFLTNGRGDFAGIRSTAKFPTAGHRPIRRTTLPEISQTRVGGHAAKEVPNVLAGAARSSGLQTYGRERLNHLTKITAAIVVSRRCFICLHAWPSARLAVESMTTTRTRRRVLRFWHSWGLVD